VLPPPGYPLPSLPPPFAVALAKAKCYREKRRGDEGTKRRGDEGTKRGGDEGTKRKGERETKRWGDEAPDMSMPEIR